MEDLKRVVIYLTAKEEARLRRMYLLTRRKRRGLSHICQAIIRLYIRNFLIGKRVEHEGE